jgi:selenocysteine-specific elongation factor
MIASAGLPGVTLAELTRRLGCLAADAATAVDALSAAGTLVRAGEWVVPAHALEKPTARLLGGLAQFHQAHPLATGLAREDARGRWFHGVPVPIVDAVLARLVGRGAIVAGETLARAGHRVALSPEDAATQEWLDRRFLDAGLAPPDVGALPGEVRRPAAAVEQVLAVMLKARRLVKVDTLVFHRDVLDRLKDEIAALKTGAPGGRATVDVKTFKDTYNVTRKYAIPLLEFLDRERVTRRAGDVRVVL